MGTIIEIHDKQLQNCRIFDCRSALTDPEYGRTQYADQHLPGAIYADLNEDLSGPVNPGKTGRHPLPEKNAFVQQLRAWGVTNDDTIVAYDDDNGAFAARLWWMMRWLGHDAVYVLDGGFHAWQRAGRPLTSTATPTKIGDFKVRPALTREVLADDLTGFSGLLLDARDAARFRGETEPVDPIAGHIPGAINAPFTDNLEDGRFKSPARLEELFAALGLKQATDVACYCGSGVTATHNILALKHAGFPEPALYPGSWSEWITDPDRPIA